MKAIMATQPCCLIYGVLKKLLFPLKNVLLERAGKSEICVEVLGSSMGKASSLALHPDNDHSALLRGAFTTRQLPAGS